MPKLNVTIPQAAWLRYYKNKKTIQAWDMLVTAAKRGDADRAEVLLSILSAWCKTRQESQAPLDISDIPEALRRIKTGGGYALGDLWQLQFNELLQKSEG